MIPVIDETHDPSRTSWVASANGHGDFPIQNLPLGVFSPPAGEPRGGVAIGDFILDLSLAARSDRLGDAREIARAASGGALNPLLGRPAGERRALRRRLSELLTDGAEGRAEVEGWLHPAASCALHLPARIGDYTDFYAGIHHALNVGRQFRPDQPLLPNYKSVPIGYHGRASSVRPSGSQVRRPYGQLKPPGAEAPTFAPSERLDIELELGVWIGEASKLGEPIPIAEAEKHIAGLCLLNDWSARDIQAWEYQPLGPFLAKNFHTSVSPWIITAEALAPFRIAQPERPRDDPAPLPYLWSEHDQARGAYGLELETFITTAAMRAQRMAPHRLGTGRASNLYWTLAQLVAHHASGGCDLNPGDLLGTGTISTPDASGLGSLLEITLGGRNAITLPTGELRAFLEDGDEVELRAKAVASGYVSIGFGACRGLIAPAIVGRMITLHGYWRSTAAYRVRIALNLKGAAYDQVFHDLRTDAQRDAAYTAIAPQGLVPALETDGAVLTQSLAILEWIDEGWPRPPLLPADRDGRAVVRAMAGLVAADIHPLNNLRVLQALRSRFGASEAQIGDWIARWILDGFEALERLVAQYGGVFAYGDQPGLADCLLVPQVYSADRFKVDLAGFPQIRRVASAAAALPAFAAAHPSVQPDADAP